MSQPPMLTPRRTSGSTADPVEAVAVLEAAADVEEAMTETDVGIVLLTETEVVLLYEAEE